MKSASGLNKTFIPISIYSSHSFSKTYTTENAYRSHLQSKKHKENEISAASQSLRSSDRPTTQNAPSSEDPKKSSSTESMTLPENEEEIVKSIDERIAAARAMLSPSSCLFCTHQSSSLEHNLTHMSTIHSFFIPDAEYLVDLPGLITYLGEKVAVGNFCIFCNEKGREFRSVDAVRKHMTDKSHCKIAYDRENDRLELSDYYDFTGSYPDADTRKKEKKGRPSGSTSSEDDIDDDEGEEWEDADDVEDNEVDEVVEASDSDSTSRPGEDDEDLPESQITYGDTDYELVLPSGARIGHRSMRRYYAQSFPGGPRGNKAEDPNSGAALVRRLLADKNAALVPRRGGFGAFGAGTDVVKARNKGEAREAGRHVREFRDQKRREDFKTKVAFIHNSQKHYRDPRVFFLTSLCNALIHFQCCNDQSFNIFVMCYKN